MLKALLNSITGRRSHWDNTFNPVINAMWQKAEQLPNPLNIIMNHFIGSAVYFIEVITNMSNQESNKVIRVDCRCLNKEKFHIILSVTLSFFVFIFVAMNRWIKEDLMRALHEVTGDPDVTNQTMQLLAMHYSRSKGPPDMQILSAKIWDRFTELTHYQKAQYPDKTAFFMLALSNIYVDSVRGIKEDTTSGTSYV